MIAPGQELGTALKTQARARRKSRFTKKQRAERPSFASLQTCPHLPPAVARRRLASVTHPPPKSAVRFRGVSKASAPHRLEDPVVRPRVAVVHRQPRGLRVAHAVLFREAECGEAPAGGLLGGSVARSADAVGARLRAGLDQPVVGPLIGVIGLGLG